MNEKGGWGEWGGGSIWNIKRFEENNSRGRGSAIYMTPTHNKVKKLFFKNKVTGINVIYSRQ